MIYVPTNLNMEQSWQLSAHIWSQVSPNSNNTTKYLVTPRGHPETSLVYFYMDRSQAEQFGLDVANAITDWPVVAE